MSLVAQLAKDLDAADAAEKNAADTQRLPLFAAAEQLYGGSESNKGLALRTVLAALLVSIVLALAYFYYWPTFANQERAALPIVSAEQNTADTTANTMAGTRTTAPTAAAEVAKPATNEAPLVDKVTVAEKAPVAVEGPSVAEKTSVTEQSITEQPAARAQTVIVAKATPADVATETATISTAVSAAGRTTIVSADSEEPIAVKTSRPVSAAQRDQALEQQARQMANNGLQASAIELLRKQLYQNGNALNTRPKSAALYFSLLLATESFDVVQRELPAFIALHADSLALAKVNVRLAIAQQDAAGALAMLDALAVPINEDVEFTELRAAVLHSQSEYLAAADAYRRLLGFDDQRARWWMGLAVALDADAQFYQAKQAYRNAMVLADGAANPLPTQLRRYATTRIAQL